MQEHTKSLLRFHRHRSRSDPSLHESAHGAIGLRQFCVVARSHPHTDSAVDFGAESVMCSGRDVSDAGSICDLVLL